MKDLLYMQKESQEMHVKHHNTFILSQRILLSSLCSLRVHLKHVEEGVFP